MTAGPGFDPFEILGVGADADEVVIQLAYRARIRTVHPDIAGQAGLEQAKRLNLARDWLLDPTRRAQLHATASTAPARPGHAQARGWGARRAHAWARARASARGHAGDRARPDGDFGPGSDRLRAFLRSIRALSADERARVNYSLGESRPPSFDAYQDYLGPETASRSRALREAVAHAWEQGVDEPAPYLPPLGRIMPSGFLVANAYAQWRLLADDLRHELADSAFRGDHLYDTLSARCRGPWEGSVGHARYGPNGLRVVAVLRTAERLPASAAGRLATSWYRHLGRDGRDLPSEHVGPGIWLPTPPGLPPALTVSGFLAAVDAARIVPPAGLTRRDQDGFRYGIRLTVHVLALGLTGKAAHAYLHPWREAVGAAI